MLGRAILQAASVRKGDFAGRECIGRAILQAASVRKRILQAASVRKGDLQAASVSNVDFASRGFRRASRYPERTFPTFHRRASLHRARERRACSLFLRGLEMYRVLEDVQAFWKKPRLHPS